MSGHPSYRDVYAGWITRIPAHWSALPVKYVCSYNDEVLPESADPGTVIQYVEISDVDQANGLKGSVVMTLRDAPSRARRQVRDGDVIVSTVRTYLRAVAPINNPPENLVVSTGFAVIRPDGLVPGFARYVLVADGFVGSVIARSTGVSYPAINASDLVRIPVPVPPVEEQNAIASYLDAETKRIDGLIEAKRKLLNSLFELKAVRITEIMTGAADHVVPTGDVWLPKIPQGWTLKRLKHLGQVRSGLAKGKKHDAGTETRELPYMRVANVQDGHLDLSDVAKLEVAADDVERYSLVVGDVLMNEGGDYDKLGRGAVWEGAISPCLHQNHVFAVRLDDPAWAPWVSALTRTAYAKFYFMNNSKQSTNLASISQSNVKEWPVALPPEDIRDQLLNQLSVELKRTDDLIEHVELELAVLEEFRSATITDAVLGRIDVREHMKN